MIQKLTIVIISLFFTHTQTQSFLIHYFKIFVISDTRVATSLMLLAHLFPPKKVKRNAKKFYKPSIAEATESIIKHLLVSIF